MLFSLPPFLFNFVMTGSSTFFKKVNENITQKIRYIDNGNSDGRNAMRSKRFVRKMLEQFNTIESKPVISSSTLKSNSL